MRRRFFVERFEGSSAAVRGETAEHLTRVLRAQPGQLYELSDGKRVFLGRIERVGQPGRSSGASVEFTLLEGLEVSLQELPITLLLSIVKFDCFEWCLEKATELGATTIIPIAAARSQKALIQAAAGRAPRWGKILLASAQQSRRVCLPSLGPLAQAGVAFGEARAGRKILLSERAESPLLKKIIQGARQSEAALAIGPEGGWTDEELKQARGRGFQEASLGGNVLRTETAAIAALAVLRYSLIE